MQILKAFKFRIYPDSDQQIALSKQFGHTRFVYNRYLNMRKEMYFQHKQTLTRFDCQADLAKLKKTEGFEWLNEGDSQALQVALKDLDTAYQNFFRMVKEGTLPKPGKKPRKDGTQRVSAKGYPTYRKKFDNQSYQYPQRFKLDGKSIYLPKVGWVRVVLHRPLEGKMKNCTVTKTKSGDYFVSIQCEVEHITPEQKAAKVGIDLGLTTFATFSDGQKIDKPKHFYASQRRLKIRQRRLSRKVKGSHSRSKARLVVATAHEKIANQRKDFHHKLSRTIVDNFGTIAFESLNINGMLKNHNLAKAIADAGWNQFVNFVEYKAAWAGAEVLKVDRFFPSSKLCSDCGAKHKSLTLNIRQWVCTECGVIHDRDENAAINILNQTTRGARESHAVGDMSVLVKTSAPEAHSL